jgi:hypothetical protein
MDLVTDETMSPELIEIVGGSSANAESDQASQRRRRPLKPDQFEHWLSGEQAILYIERNLSSALPAGGRIDPFSL